MPILKGKEGEFDALRSLQRSRRAQILPVIELLPPPYDFAAEAPTRSMDDHAALMAPKLSRGWGPDAHIILDGQYIDNEESSAAEDYPLDRILTDCRMRHIQPILATGTRRSDEYQDAVKRAHRRDRRGVCVRLDRQDLGADVKLEDVLKEVTERVGVSPLQTDLLLDLGAVTESEEAQLVLRVGETLRNLPSAGDWRSLALSGSAFPESLTGCGAGKRSTIARVEWTLWKTLLADRRPMPRPPIFADFGITHPQPLEIDPRIMKMRANLRYTSADVWAVFRGRDLDAYEQFNELCGMLVGTDEFCGPRFSGGDQMVERFAAGRGGPGSPTTWREIGTSHHIEFVLRELGATPGAGSEAAA